ncbi:MAG: hypothetical protein NZM35_03315 [Chitinophagales bacterium]|nr:hypothetical protein [Chitinophagales bacterium]
MHRWLFTGVVLMCSVAACKKDKNPGKVIIVYISTADHNYGEIYTCAMDGTGAKRISELGAKNLSDSEYEPVFSPDGSKIKYRSFNYMLKVYDVNSGNTVSIDKAWSSAWSSDGKKIAYISQSNLDRPINTANADGTNVKKITNYEYFTGDTTIFFNGIAWYEKENVIISRGNVQIASNPGANGSYLVKIHPESGYVTGMYPLHFTEDFSLSGSKISWANEDTVFIHDLISKTTSHFVTAGEKPLNPSLSPDGSRVAYITNRHYVLGNDTTYYTDMLTRSINGFDKRELTQGTIPDDVKYKSLFYPFWLSNSELLYAAGKIYKIKDDASPSASALTDALRAGGQLQANKK